MTPSERCAALLIEFIVHGSGSALLDAADLGRELSAAEQPVEQIGELYEQALMAVARAKPELLPPAAVAQILPPLTEILMAYGLSQRRRLMAMQRQEAARQKAERQALRTQKLESLGVLAGGVAHDFNNLLLGVLGRADLALLQLPPHSPVRQNLQRIRHTAVQLSELTAQMLAYAGKGTYEQVPIDANAMIEEVCERLRSSVSPKITLSVNPASSLPTIEGDPSQLRQVLVNLINNSVEAIGAEHGVVSISTGARDIGADALRRAVLSDLPEGRYLSIEVSDTGAGMDA